MRLSVKINHELIDNTFTICNLIKIIGIQTFTVKVRCDKYV